MKVLIGQVSPVVGDIEGNLERCLEAFRKGQSAGVDVVVLPELVLSGYPPRDFLQHEGFVEACEQASAVLVKATAKGGPILVFGLPTTGEDGIRNTAVVACDGQVAGHHHKVLLPTYDVFDEARYFVRGTAPRPVRARGHLLGITVCEDIWHEDHGRVDAARGAGPGVADPVGAMAGCEVLLNLSASPFHTSSPHRPSKARTRLEVVRRSARRLGAPVVLVNQVGGNDELVFDGHSLAVAPSGGLLAQGHRFAPDLRVVDLGSPARESLAEMPFEEEVVRTLTLGLRDYTRRCGFRSVVLGLSGGIDSALVCALAARALGPRNVVALAMPGPYSSASSLHDARDLASRLGVELEEITIGPAYEAFRGLLRPRFRDRPFDVTEENLQARIRGTLVMAVSNKEAHLALNTGNKSELAVGYCTLYGDMAGGLAVISDLFKTDVYRVCRWLNREERVIPAHVLDRPPSAELAPRQRDDDSLPPYSVLDPVLRLYLEEQAAPETIVARGHERAVVDRAVRLVTRAEYKRWQAAPGLRVSAKAFGSGRRIPVAQGWEPRAGGGQRGG